MAILRLAQALAMRSANKTHISPIREPATAARIVPQKVEMLPLEALPALWPGNARNHVQEAAPQIAKALEARWLLQPVLVDDQGQISLAREGRSGLES